MRWETTWNEPMGPDARGQIQKRGLPLEMGWEGGWEQ